MPKTIKVKSTPDNWRKEYTGIKNNTLRTFGKGLKDTIRKEILDDYINGKWNLINIEVENTHTSEVFTRSVRDVTKYKQWYIITWWHR